MTRPLSRMVSMTSASPVGDGPPPLAPGCIALTMGSLLDLHQLCLRRQQAVDRLGLELGEILVGDLAGGPGLFGLLELAPDGGRVTQLPFGMIVEHLTQLDDLAQRHKRKAEKQCERVHVSPPAGCPDEVVSGHRPRQAQLISHRTPLAAVTTSRPAATPATCRRSAHAALHEAPLIPELMDTRPAVPARALVRHVARLWWFSRFPRLL